MPKTYMIFIPVLTITLKFVIAILGTYLVICGWDKILKSLKTKRFDMKVIGKKDITITIASI